MIFKDKISLDLGTSSTIVYIRGKGITLQEPSIVAVDDKNQIIAIGDEARRRIGFDENLREIRPLKDGIISDYNMVRQMVEYFLKKSIKNGIFRPDITICTPKSMTDLEKKGIIEAAEISGGTNIRIITEPLAAAMGAGLDIESPYAKLIVDMGGGTTDISVIKSREIIYSLSIKEGGDTLNQDIRNHIKREYNSDISMKSAENIKRRIGSAIICPRVENLEVNVWDLETDEQKRIILQNTEIQKAIEKSLNSLIGAIKEVISGLKDQDRADINNNGIILVGGGALLEGIDRLIAAELGIKTRVVDNPITAIARGTDKIKM
ncbi:MAG: rod shape-determining protein [Andreesenia angusta]|nr:rod shape-determining protein [Andreesenia angusta]